MDEKNIYSRTEILLGNDNLEKLKRSVVMVCGLGGVGGYTAEALIRIGVGKIIFVDSDCTDSTNLNRQILSTEKTVGIPKVDSAVERAKSINSNGVYVAEKVFLTPENIPSLLEKYNPVCVADAIDNITAKLSLAVECQKRDISLISSMGTGNKTDPQRFKGEDIFKTTVCPLARAMRPLLKERGIKKLRVVYSDEMPRKNNREIGTLSFVPATAGLILAHEVIKTIVSL